MAANGEESVLQNVWYRVRAHNDWQLVVDEDAFLARAMAITASLDTSGMIEGKLAQSALTRAYGEIIYTGLVARQERAALELWQAFWRLGLRRGEGPETADELAQEAVTRVLEGLPALRSPQSLIFWAFKIFYTVVREHIAAQSSAAPTVSSQEIEMEPIDPADQAADVEQRLVDSDLLERIAAKLPNDLERQVILRVLGAGDTPRDIARDLGLPLHRTRIAKSRALKKLRADNEFAELIRGLADDPNLQPQEGASDDETES